MFNSIQTNCQCWGHPPAMTEPAAAAVMVHLHGLPAPTMTQTLKKMHHKQVVPRCYVSCTIINAATLLSSQFCVQFCNARCSRCIMCLAPAAATSQSTIKVRDKPNERRAHTGLPTSHPCEHIKSSLPASHSCDLFRQTHIWPLKLSSSIQSLYSSPLVIIKPHKPKLFDRPQSSANQARRVCQHTHLLSITEEILSKSDRLTPLQEGTTARCASAASATFTPCDLQFSLQTGTAAAGTCLFGLLHSCQLLRC